MLPRSRQRQDRAAVAQVARGWFPRRYRETAPKHIRSAQSESLAGLSRRDTTEKWWQRSSIGPLLGVQRHLGGGSGWRTRLVQRDHLTLPPEQGLRPAWASPPRGPWTAARPGRGNSDRRWLLKRSPSSLPLAWSPVAPVV